MEIFINTPEKMDFRACQQQAEKTAKNQERDRPALEAFLERRKKLVEKQANAPASKRDATKSLASGGAAMKPIAAGLGTLAKPAVKKLNLNLRPCMMMPRQRLRNPPHTRPAVERG